MKSTAPNFEISLSEYVDRAQSGDSDAFRHLIESTSSMVNSIALAIVKNTDDADDVSQQTFISVWQTLDRLNNPQSFLPWIRQITRNTAFKLIRDRGSNKMVRGIDADQLLSLYSDPGADLESAIQREQQGVVLSKFIDSMPTEDREVVLLYYREGESSKRVAQLLGLSDANVRKKLSRARAGLKESLLKKYGKLLLASAPPVGFSSVVLSALVPPTPVAAATITSGWLSQNTPWLIKALVMFSGAMLGAFIAVCAIFIGSNQQLKYIDDVETQAKIKDLRNKNALFMLVFGILFSLSYELTESWLAPVGIYTLFAVGLGLFIYRNRVILNANRVQGVRTNGQWLGVAGLVVGLLCGYAGLIIGLVNSGRLLW